MAERQPLIAKQNLVSSDTLPFSRYQMRDGELVLVTHPIRGEEVIVSLDPVPQKIQPPVRIYGPKGKVIELTTNDPTGTRIDTKVA